MESIARQALARTYPDHRWRNIAHGHTEVWALEGSPDLYVKIAPIGDSLEPGLSPMAEADRNRWLSDQGIACPTVIDAGLLDEEEYLVMKAVPGVPLAACPEPGRADAVDAAARFLKHLHAIPTDACPYDRRLRVTVPMAQEAAGLGEVDPSRLDTGRRRHTTTMMVTELLATARQVGREEPVVCHGNLSAGNILVDPQTSEVTATLSNARCGIADRYTDLAKITRELAESCGPPTAQRFIYRYGETPLDPDRLRFYRLLDCFW